MSRRRGRAHLGGSARGPQTSTGPKLIRPWEPIAMACLGVLGCVGGVAAVAVDDGIDANSVRTSANVLSVRGGGRFPDEAKVEFQVGERRVTAEFAVDRDVDAGDHIEVEYDRDDPANARLAGDSADREFGYVMLVGGAGALGWAAWAWPRRRPRPARDRAATGQRRNRMPQGTKR